MMSTLVHMAVIVRKLDNAQFERIIIKEVVQLREIFRKYKHELRIVGGAVRDLLRDVEPRDIDFATTANIYEMKNMFYKESIYMINLKGEKHGTVTVHMNNKNFEITTLRIKKRLEDATDPSMWQADASKRDLTVNAMFLDFNGSLYDYFNGYNHLLEKRVLCCRFVCELMLEMIECDIPQYCGLIEKANVDEFKRACSAEKPNQILIRYRWWSPC
uniref:Poly A polymerase head domain-containing protein n=1 Tax=Glossina austeni TaxID=7395 RepID=A0A1A9VGJ8_GLOAU